MTVTQETLDKLARYDTPTVCNVIELFDVRPRDTGFMDGRIEACFPGLAPMVGFASTAVFRSSAPPAGGDAYGDFIEQVEAFDELPGPAVVVFQDTDDPPVGATFGEVMCSVYRADARMPIDECIRLAGEMGFDAVEILEVQMHRKDNAYLQSLKRQALVAG